jgi:outer membrane protein insertion porin family/translocation and assembly module TamA
MLFPSNYGDAFSNQNRCNGPVLPPEYGSREECDKALERDLGSDLQLLQFRAFFSGGANSNRGYGYNEVGPHGMVPSLTGGQSDKLVPTGGLSLWESSLELRFPISGNFGATIFVDASDVTRDEAFFRLTRPHLSTGLGLRYMTPVGPLRVDLGYRIPCAQVFGVCPDEALPGDEGEPGTVLGLPIAVSLAIGEAF